MLDIHIRQAGLSDLDRCELVESESFPPAEAAPRASIRIRLERFPQGFLVAECDGRVVGMINSGATDKDDISDEELKALKGHEPDGRHLVVFSLSVLPSFRRRGIGRQLMLSFLDLARKQGREAVLLLCKEHMSPFYESCGFSLRGPSACTHGGARWLEMAASVPHS